MNTLLNYHEYLTELTLNPLATRYGVRVAPKVRVADVLPINNSGISNRWFQFALRSHFDFVVVDAQTRPLFAVEYDGPSHITSQQKERDSIKDNLCAHFQFPILRVNSNHLQPKYRGLDLLTWLVEQWFLGEAFQKAQEEGFIPADEPFDPLSVYGSLTGPGREFPLWLSRDILISIQKLYTDGHLSDPVPSHMIGVDKEEHYHGISFLRINRDFGAYAYSGMRKQRFPVVESELLGEVLVFELWECLQEILGGQREAVFLQVIDGKIAEFQKRYKWAGSGGYGDYPWIW